MISYLTMKTTDSFPLRLPKSLKHDLEELAKSEDISLNQLINLILANAVGRCKTGSLWMEVQNAKS